MANDEIFRRTDGKFTVVGWREFRHRSYSYRGRSRVRGDQRPCSFSARSEAELIRLCDALWRDYLKGEITATPEERPLTVGEAITSFCGRPKLTKKTRASYERALKLLAEHVDPNLPLVGLGQRMIRSWLDGMTCNATSKATYLRTAKALSKYLLKNGWIKEDPTSGLKVEVTQQIGSWLAYSDWDHFLAACWPGHRIRAGFVLETGLRAGELIACRWSWIHQVGDRPAVQVAERDGFRPKWGRARAVPLSERAQYWLREARQRWATGTWIFSDEQLLAPKLARENKAACRKASLPDVTFHGLRRSAGARWLELGMPLLTVSRLLGHREITTTTRWYAGIADSTLAQEMARVDRARRAG